MAGKGLYSRQPCILPPQESARLGHPSFFLTTLCGAAPSLIPSRRKKPGPVANPFSFLIPPQHSVEISSSLRRQEGAGPGRHSPLSPPRSAWPGHPIPPPPPPPKALRFPRPSDVKKAPGRVGSLTSPVPSNRPAGPPKPPPPGIALKSPHPSAFKKAPGRVGSPASLLQGAARPGHPTPPSVTALKSPHPSAFKKAPGRVGSLPPPPLLTCSALLACSGLNTSLLFNRCSK